MKLIHRKTEQLTTVTEVPLSGNFHGMRAHEITFTTKELRKLINDTTILQRLQLVFVPEPVVDNLPDDFEVN